jgi:2-polyprenyl-3-methyl-5-hydroxy-6-metoxy-1,4-benzoquinol methylase
MTAFRTRGTRGHFEEIHADDRVCRVSGWMLNPSVAVDLFEVAVDGTVLISEAPRARPDVKQLYSWIPHADRSGFQFVLPAVPTGAIVVRGRNRGNIATELRSAVSTTVSPADPPPALIRRVTGQDRLPMFRAEGLHWSAEFSDFVARHTPDTRVGRLLDWGCGCGRLTVPLLEHHTGADIHGCDIDEEAIAWCRSHLPQARFETIAPYPPTPYPSASFDVVIAASVFTHLSRHTQSMWLEELKRIVRPGGIVVASVHGRFAASFAFRSLDLNLEGRLWHYWLASTMAAKGFVDLEDRSFDGVVPDKYYRRSFQTPRFTMRTWSRQFSILEYVEGALGYQDIVVMRRALLLS